MYSDRLCLSRVKETMLLQCKNLLVGYDSKVVLSNISFEINSGDYLSILGANGSGKSTLAKALLGILPTVGGQIVFSEQLKKNEIGYLPQQLESQKDFPATVFEIVLSGCLNGCGLKPFYSRKQKQMALSNMEKLGIAGLAKCSFRELSGGQQQRVLLARALCATKKLLLLDEPTSGLDAAATEGLYKQIKALNQEGITVIMISHDIEAALEYSSHILQLTLGEVTFFGKAENFKD